MLSLINQSTLVSEFFGIEQVFAKLCSSKQASEIEPNRIKKLQYDLFERSLGVLESLCSITETILYSTNHFRHGLRFPMVTQLRVLWHWRRSGSTGGVWCGWWRAVSMRWGQRIMTHISRISVILQTSTPLQLNSYYDSS